MSVVEVDDFHAIYAVAAGDPDPEARRWRLDRIARTRLRPALASALAGALDDGDRSLRLVRRMDVEVQAPPGDDDEALERAWAEALARALAGLERGEHDGDAVRRFDDRAHYMAALVAALADGTAWDAWWFRDAEVVSLRPLPAGAAICEAFVRGSAPPLAVLARLARAGALETVLAALGEREAERVLVACRRDAPAAVAARASLTAGRTADPGPPTASPPSARATAPGSAEGEPVAPHAALRALLRAALPPAPQPTPAAAPPSPPTAEPTAAHDAPRAAPPHARPRAPAAPSARPAPSADDALVTPWASAFLLVRELLELDVEGLIAAGSGDDATAEGARALILVRALGGPRALIAPGDAGFRLAAGLPDGVRPPWHEPPPGLRVQRRLIGRLAELDRVGGRFLVAEVGPDGLLVVRDALRDAWVDAAHVAPGEEREAVAAALERAAAALPLAPEAVLLRGRLTAIRRLPDVRIAGEDEEPLREWLRCARPLDAELDVLRVPGEHDEPAWLLVAHAAVRGLAGRLMGLSWSAIGHLQANLLSGTGTIRRDGERLTVELPACPLLIVLRLAGLDGTVISPPWLDGADVTLRLPEG